MYDNIIRKRSWSKQGEANGGKTKIDDKKNDAVCVVRLKRNHSLQVATV